MGFCRARLNLVQEFGGGAAYAVAARMFSVIWATIDGRRPADQAPSLDCLR